MTQTHRLVRVATAQNPTEAAVMQAALRDSEIPSIDRPTRAFDILDLLAVGPRDIMVDEADLHLAREVLDIQEPVQPIGSTPTAFAEAPSRLFAKLMLGVGGAALIVWAVSRLFL